MSHSGSSSSSSDRKRPPSSSSSVRRNSVEVQKDINGIDQVYLMNQRGYSVRVSLHGCQVLSWRTNRGEELLFTSTKSIKQPKAVRGGITICFPQFGNHGTSENHGFARNKIWVIDTNPPPLPASDYTGKTYADLLLKPSDDDLKIWPHSFEFRVRVALGADGHLNLTSRIRNIDEKPFSYSIAFHTYFSVSDIGEVRIEGLETHDYLDNLNQRVRCTDQGNSLTFEEEMDRIYIGTPNTVAILDHEKKQTYFVKKEGLPDVVIWNPWDKKAKAIPDLGDEEYKRMICVDGAAIDTLIPLKPNEEWTGRVELSLVYSS